MKRFLLPFAVAVLLVGVVVAGAMLLRDDGTKPAAAATPSAAKLAKQKRVWIRHAGAVCRWIGRRDATLARAYRSGFQSLDHVASVVEYIYAVHRQAAGVFRRLTPPP